MKNYTDKNKPHLGQTISSIELMYSSLQSLYETVYPKSPEWFAIMAQGPINDIRSLLDDVEWLMQSMIPSELREQALQSEKEEQQEATDTIAA